MKVYLNDPIAKSAVARLQEHVELVSDFEHPEELDAIIVRQQHVTREVIERATRCRLIQQHGVGLDRIDVAAAEERGMLAANGLMNCSLFCASPLSKYKIFSLGISDRMNGEWVAMIILNAQWRFNHKLLII